MGERDPVIHGKVLEWGDDVGIRISKADAKRAGLRVGQDIVARLLMSPLDVSHLPTFHDGEGVDNHDRFLGEAVSKSLGLKPK